MIKRTGERKNAFLRASLSVSRVCVTFQNTLPGETECFGAIPPIRGETSEWMGRSSFLVIKTAALTLRVGVLEHDFGRQPVGETLGVDFCVIGRALER